MSPLHSVMKKEALIMKVINCGIVTYIIVNNHIATIAYNYNDGQPIARIYYDGQIGEIVECENGQTMRQAFKLAAWTLKETAYCEGL